MCSNLSEEERRKKEEEEEEHEEEAKEDRIFFLKRSSTPSWGHCLSSAAVHPNRKKKIGKRRRKGRGGRGKKS